MRSEVAIVGCGRTPYSRAKPGEPVRTVDDYIAWAADLAWQGRVREADGVLMLDADGLPAALVQRLLARAVATLAGRPVRGSDIARLAARLGNGQTGTLAGVQANAGRVWRICVTRPPQKRSKTA